MLTVPAKWLDYASGHQPVDPFLGRPIVPDLEWKAGGLYSLKPMMLWTLKETGAQNFVRWDPNAGTALELVVSATPGLNRVVRTSDYGYREAQREGMVPEERSRARDILELPDQVRSFYNQYWALRGLKDHRTEPQERAYQALNTW
ncbi:MAG TPA: hypothetical protein VGD41_17985, partial [Pyrinomonadaceae bacterium]